MCYQMLVSSRMVHANSVDRITFAHAVLCHVSRDKFHAVVLQFLLKSIYKDLWYLCSMLQIR